MNAIDRILNEVDADYDAYKFSIPRDLRNEYPVLSFMPRHSFSVRIALVMINYALVKYAKSSECDDEYMRSLFLNVQTFAAARLENGREAQSELGQYYADYMAWVNQNGGCLFIPQHLDSSWVDTVINSVEGECFPFIDYLVSMILEKTYSGNSANLYMHFITRAENRYVIYKPLFDEHYYTLRRG